MSWIALTSLDQLDKIKADSETQTQVIFKHSTRCSISSMAMSRFERKWKFGVPTYLLDLIALRNISNEIAERFEVHHESPQVLIIKNGECTFDESHNAIDPYEVEEAL